MIAPIYRSQNGGSRSIIQVAQKLPVLTFNRNWLDRNYKPGLNETPFKEVRMATKIDQRLAKDLPETSATFNVHIKEMVDGLIEYFNSTLEESQKYICFCSSGYDSRILAGVLKLVKPKPRMHFRCHEPEVDAFTEVMNILEWKDYHGFRKSSYRNAHESVANGWVKFWLSAMNFWPDINPKEWIVITGFAGGELFSYRARKKKPPTKVKFCDNRTINQWLNYLPRGVGFSVTGFKEIMFPYASFHYLDKALRTKPGWITVEKGTLDRVRAGMLRDIGGRLNVDQMKTTNIGHAPDRKLSRVVEQKVMDRWNKSGFRRRFKVKADILNHKDKYSNCIHGFSTCYDAINRARVERGLPEII